MKKETSCINSRAIIDYVKDHKLEALPILLEHLDPEIDSLSDPEVFLRDANNWISCDVLAELYKLPDTLRKIFILDTLRV
jgi:hypothetical protein